MILLLLGGGGGGGGPEPEPEEPEVEATSEFSDAELVQLRNGLPRFGVFFRLETDPVVYLWLGVGDIQPGVNALDETGQTYRGAGQLVDIPVFQQLVDGAAEQIEFTLSNIPASVFAEVAPLVPDQQTAIEGTMVAVGWAAMDYDWQLIGPIWWEWFGFGDFLRIAHPVTEGPEAYDIWTITLSAGSWNSERSRQGGVFWTQYDHGRRSQELNPSMPEDLMCERTVLLTDTEKNWPDY